MHSSSLLCCHSGLDTEPFDVLQISNFIIENPLLVSPTPYPLLSSPSVLLRLNKLFYTPPPAIPPHPTPVLKLRN